MKHYVVSGGTRARCRILLLLWLSVVLFVVVASSSKNEEDHQQQQQQQETWLHQSIQKIHHHKRNIEKALLQVKFALVKNNPQQQLHSKSMPWTRPGARIARDTAMIKSPDETDKAVQTNVLEVSEPHIGMVFQVSDVNDDRRRSCSMMSDDDDDDDERDTQSGLSERSTAPDNDDSEKGDETPDDMTMYELLEPVQLDLGVIPEHFFDYAYMPVAVGEQDRKQHAAAHVKATSKDEDENSGGVSVQPESNVAPVLTSMWWQWWFTVLGSSSSSQHTTRGRQSSRYERVGKSAFAGGSHGEVWRGRRRCGSNDNEEQCDDKTVLILKRLKVVHGLALLEAGLREVYMGNMFASDAEARPLFTVYVDHFFREVPRPSFLGRGASKEHELWIVFEDAGPSLRSYLYTAVPSGDFVFYQQSPLWSSLRFNAANISQSSEESCLSVPSVHWRRDPRDSVHRHTNRSLSQPVSAVGRSLMREILKQVLTSAAYLHQRGIVHRDIKPSNIMCGGDFDLTADITELDPANVNCVLGDFSSAWDKFADENLYYNGPTVDEQTLEYAPPEALPGPSWIPFFKLRPYVYDSWSIGVLALELLLGTPNVFSVDQRTTALLTNKMQARGASEDEIQRALYLAALSQFCIYMPTSAHVKSWPLRDGDPLFNAAMVKQSCTLKDFHHALRARDPLGIGFDSRDDPLLHLIWKLLAWDPLERIAASEALQHPYFTVIEFDACDDPTVAGSHNALESLALDPRMDIQNVETVTEFTCPKCGRIFEDWHSCHAHATSRRHAKFCIYDRRTLPTCLNAHSMLPAHPNSGYCDIQGRRRTIEDFHSIHLHPTHQFYGIFDGHTGNLASKFAAATAYKEISKRLSGLDEHAVGTNQWREDMRKNLTESFETIHDNFLKAVSFSPAGVMDQSGTTATIVYVTDVAVVVASVGDSRAILSSNQRHQSGLVTMSAIPLSVDHVASDPKEKVLVEKRGGIIVSGVLPRVNGTLAITRSLGDARLSPWLSRVPHVVALSRRDVLKKCGNSESDGVPCFIVLASDGLWDTVSNEEAVDMVRQVVQDHDTRYGISWENGGAFQEAAEVLTQEAYVRGSTDNIGVCVIAID